jgi:hypothetical protein
LSSRQTLKVVTANMHVAVLPDASVAVQVTEVVPTGNGVPEGGTHTTVAPGQLSVTTGNGNVATAVVEIGQVAGATAVTSGGQSMVGASVSFTVTVNMHCCCGGPGDVHVTVVVPTGKKSPEAGTQVAGPQVPEGVGGGKVTIAPHWPGSLETGATVGHMIPLQTAPPHEVPVEVSVSILMP